MLRHLQKQLDFLITLMRTLDVHGVEEVLSDMEKAIRSGHTIIATGLGKNVPICEKFVGTLLSVGISARFIHSNDALHGDLGAVRSGDVVLLLSKSGETQESVAATIQMKKKGAIVWLLTYSKESTLSRVADKTLVLHLDHEGDPRNIVPNNSTIGFLFMLQGLAMELIDRLGVDLESFAQNHPGGHIGQILGVSSHEDSLVKRT